MRRIFFRLLLVATASFCWWWWLSAMAKKFAATNFSAWLCITSRQLAIDGLLLLTTMICRRRLNFIFIAIVVKLQSKNTVICR